MIFIFSIHFVEIRKSEICLGKKYDVIKKKKKNKTNSVGNHLTLAILSLELVMIVSDLMIVNHAIAR